jgi:hypothetical protein
LSLPCFLYLLCNSHLFPSSCPSFHKQEPAVRFPSFPPSSRSFHRSPCKLTQNALGYSHGHYTSSTTLASSPQSLSKFAPHRLFGSLKLDDGDGGRGGDGGRDRDGRSDWSRCVLVSFPRAEKNEDEGACTVPRRSSRLYLLLTPLTALHRPDGRGNRLRRGESEFFHVSPTSSSFSRFSSFLLILHGHRLPWRLLLTPSPLPLFPAHLSSTDRHRSRPPLRPLPETAHFRPHLCRFAAFEGDQEGKARERGSESCEGTDHRYRRKRS